MNRIIRVRRASKDLLPDHFIEGAIRIEVITLGDLGQEQISEYLVLTPDEAIELHAILGLFQFNNWISSVTGSAPPPIVPTEWRSDPRKGGAS